MLRKTPLRKVLKGVPQACSAWKISDIQGINRNFVHRFYGRGICTSSPTSRRVNQKSREKTTFTCPYGKFATVAAFLAYAMLQARFNDVCLAIFHATWLRDDGRKDEGRLLDGVLRSKNLTSVMIIMERELERSLSRLKTRMKTSMILKRLMKGLPLRRLIGDFVEIIDRGCRLCKLLGNMELSVSHRNTTKSGNVESSMWLERFLEKNRISPRIVKDLSFVIHQEFNSSLQLGHRI
ncbi:hypothetical protein Tco_0536751 [Tanacetum coccineum]